MIARTIPRTKHVRLQFAYSVSRVRAMARALELKNAFFSKSCLFLLYFCGENQKTGMATGLGIVATGAAFLNYRSAKRDYEDLVEKRDGLVAAVQMFNSGKDAEYIEQLEQEYAANAVSYPEDVKCTAILRTAYLVGKLFRCVASVIITNLSNKTYQIGNVGATCWVLDQPIYVYDLSGALKTLSSDAKQVPQNKAANITLQPNETVEIPLAGGVSAVADMGALRQMVCDAAGKKLITSCPKISIENGIKVNIDYTWRAEGETDWHKAVYKQLNGVFRYCMELPLYANS